MKNTLLALAALTVGGCATGNNMVEEDKVFEENRVRVKQELLAELGVTVEGVSSDNSAVACVEESYGFVSPDTERAKMQAIIYMVEQACGEVFFVEGRQLTSDGHGKASVPGFSRKVARTYGPEPDDDIICVGVTLARGKKIEDIQCR
ncbi:hypothetical protein HZC21_02400 [Candidatus Peregrinibacteria bacterium]|nr:hypothetical protein [Candidatus Peregrinibacteria bacterium]